MALKEARDNTSSHAHGHAWVPSMSKARRASRFAHCKTLLVAVCCDHEQMRTCFHIHEHDADSACSLTWYGTCALSLCATSATLASQHSALLMPMDTATFKCRIVVTMLYQPELQQLLRNGSMSATARTAQQSRSQALQEHCKPEHAVLQKFWQHSTPAHVPVLRCVRLGRGRVSVSVCVRARDKPALHRRRMCAGPP